MGIRILYVGELVGKSGVFTLKHLLKKAKADLRVDFAVVNADSATGGAGLGMAHAAYIRKLGADCITTGEQCYYKKDIVEHFEKAPYLLRPANYPYSNPGRGYRVYRGEKASVAVIQLLGQAGFPRVHLYNPFEAASDLLPRLRKETPYVIFEFHAATTAEKQAMAIHVDGRCSAMIGAHCKALTADARLMPKGTAAITDAGRTGSSSSVGGMDAETRIKEYMTGIPLWAGDSARDLELQGCIVELKDDGTALSIEAIRLPCKEVMDDGKGKGDGDLGPSP